MRWAGLGLSPAPSHHPRDRQNETRQRRQANEAPGPTATSRNSTVHCPWSSFSLLPARDATPGPLLSQTVEVETSVSLGVGRAKRHGPGPSPVPAAAERENLFEFGEGLSQPHVFLVTVLVAL